MEQVFLQRIGTTNNMFASHGGNFYNVFRHVGWRGLLCLTVDRMQQAKGVEFYNRIPLHYNNCCGNTGDDKYTARFFSEGYYGINKSDLAQLIDFVKEHFQIELIVPE